MILKNIFGKTIEAAKKSASAIYGEDFLVLDSAEAAKKGDKARITIFSDQEKNKGKQQQQPRKRASNGVEFKRSLASAEASSEHVSPVLKSLRKYAEEQELSNPKINQGKYSFQESYAGEKEYRRDEERTPASQEKPSIKMYSRSAIRQQLKEEVRREEQQKRMVIRDDFIDKETKEDSPSKIAALQKQLEEIEQEAEQLVDAPKADPFTKIVENNAEEEVLPSITSEEENKVEGSQSVNNETTVEPKATETPAPSKGFIRHFNDSRFKDVTAEPTVIVQTAPSQRSDQREIKALHKRFDKIESLLDSAMISANLDYASHPAFQQLVKTGINTSVIAGWFSEIIQKGIDPYQQPDQFMAKLAAIIRGSLGKTQDSDPKKNLLFVGPAGAGKTTTIIKLIESGDHLADKSIAVISIRPDKAKQPFYYSILEPFCNDHDIPFFDLQVGEDISALSEQLDSYDHVLIDTPSLNTEQQQSFREYWKIRQWLTAFTDMEVHYVVNAALNRFYFKNSNAAHHPLQPDFVAITHLDEVSQWGPVIPFMQQMGCNARYLGTGNSTQNGLKAFDPQWFARKVLQES
tara:strand:- start:217056 stop:218786 length:1731 start_codon:yes stop_codon:yes gene_type:complete